jgi:hypothetical protein
VRRRAAKVDANHSAIVEALRKVGCKVLSLAANGKGCPDLLVGVPTYREAVDTAGYVTSSYPYRLVLIEVKDGAKPASARKLTPDQVAFHAEWASAPIFVVETVEQAIAVVQK